MDNTGCLTAVPLRSSSSKLSILIKFFGTFPRLEKPKRYRAFSDFRPFIVLGNLERLLQSFKFNKSSPLRSSLDNGSS